MSIHPEIKTDVEKVVASMVYKWTLRNKKSMYDITPSEKSLFMQRAIRAVHLKHQRMSKNFVSTLELKCSPTKPKKTTGSIWDIMPPFPFTDMFRQREE